MRNVVDQCEGYRECGSLPKDRPPVALLQLDYAAKAGIILVVGCTFVLDSKGGTLLFLCRTFENCYACLCPKNQQDSESLEGALKWIVFVFIFLA